MNNNCLRSFSKFTVYLVFILLASGCGSTVIDYKLSLDVQKNEASISSKDKIYRDIKKAAPSYAYFPIVYENKNIRLRFNTNNLYLFVFFENKSNSQLKVLWAKAKIFSDENANGVPLIARLTRPDIRAKHTGYKDYYVMKEQIVEPNSKGATRFKPDYRQIFKSDLIFGSSIKDKPVYLASQFKDKELSIYLPIIEEGVETTYLFKLKVLDAKARTSYY